MRFDGPTVALLADNSFGGMGLSDLANIPMSASRLMNRNNGASAVMPPHMKNAFSSPGLSLGLQPNCPDMQLEGKPVSEAELGKTSKSNKEDENESRSGSGSENMGNASGDEQEPPRKKRYHRHTARQIQEMESLFKECPHPDDKQRQELSRELGLEPRQVKFWFQNRRTQLKAQQERQENSMLRVEVEKLRAENITMREAIRNASCPNCGGPATLREMSFEEQHLRIENACLKDELDRVSAVAAKFFGRSVPPMMSQQAPQFSGSSLNLSMGAANNPPMTPSSVAAAGSGAQTMGLLTAPPAIEDPIKTGSNLSDVEKSSILDIAISAMEEILQLSQPDSAVWIPSADSSREIFNQDEYIHQFPKSLETRPCEFKTDATRESGLVMMNAASLVEIFMDAGKWMELFSANVSKAITLEVLSSVPGSLSGTLQLMYAEIQVLSPLIQTREIYFLRYCKQHPDGTWAIADVSVDGLRGTPSPNALRCRRSPSGIIIHEMPDSIHDMPNGCSKVVVIEHMEYDDHSTHQLFRSLVSSGGAFGAQKWLATLQRQCEALTSYLPGMTSPRDIGAIPSSPGRQSLLKLSQRMTNSFCNGVGASSTHTWTTLSGSGGDDVRVMTRKSIDNPGEPHGIVLSAATTIWLPSSPQRVFDYIRCEHVRSEWDIAPNGGMVQEVARIAKSQANGNDVSLFRIDSLNSNQNNMLILQESCTDQSGSLVVYAPVELSTITVMMQGGDPAHVAVLPSGFAILPDGASDHSGLLQQHDGLAIEKSSGGTLLTVAVQILVSTLPSAKLSLESVVAINNLISSTIQKVKSALTTNSEL